MSKSTANRFSPEVRERTLHLVQEHQAEYPVAVPSGIALDASSGPARGCDVANGPYDHCRRYGQSASRSRLPTVFCRSSEPTLEWVTWFNQKRLLSSIGYIPPAEAEANYYKRLGVQSEKVVLLKRISLRDFRSYSLSCAPSTRQPCHRISRAIYRNLHYSCRAQGIARVRPFLPHGRVER